MNLKTVRRLVAKDWHLHRAPVTLTATGSVVAIVLLMLGGTPATNLGINLAVAVLITLTFYLPLMSVVEERGQRTLPFLMSLPVSTNEYVASKVTAALSLYMLPWLTLAVGAYLASTQTDSPIAESGWVPVVLLGMASGFCFILSIALITDSGGWTLALTVLLLFLFGNVFTQDLPWTQAVTDVTESIHHRGRAYRVALIGETVLIITFLATAFVANAKKRDFV